MKRYFFLLVATVATLTCSAAEMDDTPIEAKALPLAAKHFLRSAFPSTDVSFATKDVDWLDVEYKVMLANGYVIEFNKSGEWTEIDGKGQALPVNLIPAAALATLKSRFPEQKITEISKDRGHYDLNLDNGLEVEINTLGEIVSIDD